MTAFFHESPFLACGCLAMVCATVAFSAHRMSEALEGAFRRWGKP